VLKVAFTDAARVIHKQATKHNPSPNIELRSLSQISIYYRSQNARIPTIALGYYPGY